MAMAYYRLKSTSFNAAAHKAIIWIAANLSHLQNDHPIDDMGSFHDEKMHTC